MNFINCILQLSCLPLYPSYCISKPEEKASLFLFVFLNVLCRPTSKCSQLTTLVTAECVCICLSILLFFRPTLLQKQHTTSCNISARVTAPAKESAIPQFFCQHSNKRDHGPTAGPRRPAWTPDEESLPVSLNNGLQR